MTRRHGEAADEDSKVKVHLLVLSTKTNVSLVEKLLLRKYLRTGSKAPCDSAVRGFSFRMI